MRITILKLPTMLAESGSSRSATYRQIKDGLWVRPIKLGLRSVGWPAHEVSQLLAARIAGKADDAIRALVTKLEAARAAGGTK